MLARAGLLLLGAVLLAAPFATAHSNARLADPLLPPGFTEAPRHDAPAARPFETTLPSSGDDAEYQLRFRCPGIQVGGLPTAVTNQTGNFCPEFILDAQDIMGSPILLIDPKEPGYAGFNAMHGGRGIHQLGNEPPSNQSRDNFLHQPHTTFYSPDGAHQHWVDNPYYSPLQLPPNRQNLEEPTSFFPVTQILGKQVFGEDNAATLDAQGRVYLASLYAWRNASNEDSFQYAIGLWKGNRVNQPVDYYQGVKVLKLPPGVRADSIHAVYVPGADRVAVLWRETNESHPLKSYINLAWTIPGRGAIWYDLKENQRIGACSGISNPLAHAGLVYVGCFAAPGYRGAANATLGRMQIHTLDARNNAWVQRYVDETTVDRGAGPTSAILFDRTDGRMGIAASGIAQNGKPFINIAYGERGTLWDPVDKFGDRVGQLVLRPPSPAYEVVEAQINAAAFILRSGNVHLVYQERYRPADDQAQPPSTNVAEFYKGLISIHSGGDRTVNRVVHLGAQNRDQNDANARPTVPACQAYEARYQGPTEDVFKDLHDSIVVWQNKHKHQREFLAYADRGCVRFAEVVEEQFLVFSFPVPPGTPPVPAPLASANPAQVGAVAGALAGAMVLRMLAFKRKVAVEAPA